MRQRKRVAVVLKGYPRLSETFIAQELFAMERAGLDLELVSLRHPTDVRRHPVHTYIRAPVRYLPEYLRDEPRRVSRAALHQVRNIRLWRLLPLFLRDYWRDPTPNRLRRIGQAIVLAQEMPEDVGWIYAHFIHTPGSVARYAAALRGLQFSISAHAKDIWTIPDWELREKLSAARWTVCCTQAYTRKLREAEPEANIDLIYHGLVLEDFPHFERGLGTNGSDSARPVKIACVARAVPKKGIDVLLRALAHLPASLHWTFEHIGGGSEGDALRELADQLGLEDHVVWRGPCDRTEVIALLQSADLFCLPVRKADDGDRDGLPNVLMEALSQQLPIVATSVGGIEELVDSSCGVLVPENDVDALVSALSGLIVDPERRLQLGREGDALIRRKFSFDRLVTPLIERLRASLDI